MRSPEIILDNLVGKEKSYVFKRLYRNFYNEEFYFLAYFNLYQKEISSKEKEYVQSMITNMRNRTYQPSKLNAEDSRNIKHLTDSLVLEILRMLLSSIYDQSFSEHSHASRSGCSNHTALKHVEGTFRGVKWFVYAKLDININKHVLINSLRKKVQDEPFIQLVFKFINAGYLTDWTYGKTYSGLPIGNTLNELLLHVYYNELDCYLESYKEQFDVGRMRKVNPEYKRLQSRLYKKRKKYKAEWDEMSEVEQEEALNYMKETRKVLQSMKYKDPMDDSYKRIQFVRSKTSLLIGVIGSNADAKKLEAELSSFIKSTLQVNDFRLHVSHSGKRTRFLGYDILVNWNSDRTKKTRSGYTQRVLSGVCQLLLPHEVWRNKLLGYKAIKINSHTNKWKSVHRTHLVHADDLEILRTYNTEIESMYNYYALANDSSNLVQFKHFMEYSMYKTFAYKYKMNVPKVIKRYKYKGVFRVTYRFNNQKQTAYFYNKGFKRRKNITANHQSVDLLPNTHMYHSSKNSMMNKLSNKTCMSCGSKENVEQHHKNKLRSTKGKRIWQRKEIERVSKVVPLCKSCHAKLHKGI